MKKIGIIIVLLMGISSVVKAQTGFSLRFNRVIDTVLVINQSVNCSHDLYASPISTTLTFNYPTKVLSVSGSNNTSLSLYTSCSGSYCGSCGYFKRYWTIDGHQIPVTDNFEAIRWVKPGSGVTIEYGSNNTSYKHQYSTSTVTYTVHVTALEFIPVP